MSIAKITRPKLSGVFHRKRLFRLLDRCRKQRPVVWITGPPGSGKTTLAGSYIEARKIPCLWYHLDEGDADVASLFYYMRHAASKASRSKRKPLPLLTPEYLAGLPTFTQNFFRDLYQRLKPPFAVVFDNYQNVPLESPFHDLMCNALSEIPEGGSVIITSRESPPSSLARLQANRTIEIIGWNELQLTLEESKGIIENSGNKKLPRKTIRQLYVRAKGWAAGLALMLEQTKSGNIPRELLTESSSKVIFAYFAEEIINKTDNKTRDFLLKTAFLNKITPSLAKELTGTRNAAQILSGLNQKNYFTIKLAQQQSAYRYHDLFREFLLARAKSTFSSKVLTKIQYKAAKLLEKEGQLEDAVRILQEIEDYNCIQDIILKHAQTILQQGRGQTLAEWITSLPDKILQKNPWLLYWLGICRLPINPSQSISYLERAFILFRTKGDNAGIFITLSDILNAIFQEGKNFRRLDHWIAMLDEVRAKKRPFPSREIENKIASPIFFALNTRQPDHPGFNYWLKKTQQLFQKSTNPDIRVIAGHILGLHFTWKGDFSQTARLLDSLHDLNESGGVSPPVRTMLGVLAVSFYWLIGFPERSLKEADSFLRTSKTTGIHIWDSHFLGFGAASAITAGDPEKAKKYLVRMFSIIDKNRNFDTSLYYMLAAWVKLVEGDLRSAKLYCETNVKIADKLGATLPQAVGYYGMSLALHESGDYKKSDSFLEKAHRTGRRMKSNMIEFMCLLANAQYAFDRGKEKNALKSLKKAMALGREKDYVNFYLFRPNIIARLCEKALTAGIEKEYVQNLIRKRNLIPESPPLKCEHWPWPLKIDTLGQFTIVIDGKPLKFIGKSQKRPLELLKTLIAFGGRSVSKEQISDTLWLDADAYAADRAFITNLQRLRKLLKHKEAIQLQGGRLSLNPQYCYVDVWAFENLIEQAEETKRPGAVTNTKKIDFLIKAIDLYKGNFLSKEPEYSWVVSFHERLRNSFIWSVSELGSHYEKKRKWRNAIEFYQKGLGMDDLHEEFYRQIMICYSKQGNRAKALSTYYRCKKLLFSILEIEPSPETEAVYKTIKLGHPG